MWMVCSTCPIMQAIVICSIIKFDKRLTTKGIIYWHLPYNVEVAILCIIIYCVYTHRVKETMH